jgi:hypothetical protein
MSAFGGRDVWKISHLAGRLVTAAIAVSDGQKRRAASPDVRRCPVVIVARACTHKRLMSAFGGKADIANSPRHVRF